MANINVQPKTARGKVLVARKQLKKRLRQFRNDFDGMTVSQRWALVRSTMIILIRIELFRIGQLGDDD